MNMPLSEGRNSRLRTGDEARGCFLYNDIESTDRSEIGGCVYVPSLSEVCRNYNGADIAYGPNGTNLGCALAPRITLVWA